MKYHVACVALTTMLVASLTGCDRSLPGAQGASPSASPDQANLCQVRDWQKDATEAACKAGQKTVFLPKSWGNEQLPILFAAVNCDLRYAVALTNGGVTCIYVGPLALESHDAAANAASAAQPAGAH
jgi:hypothetical protein